MNGTKRNFLYFLYYFYLFSFRRTYNVQYIMYIKFKVYNVQYNVRCIIMFTVKTVSRGEGRRGAADDEGLQGGGQGGR